METPPEISEPTMDAFCRYAAGLPPVRYRRPVRACDDPVENFQRLRGQWTEKPVDWRVEVFGRDVA